MARSHNTPHGNGKRIVSSGSVSAGRNHPREGTLASKQRWQLRYHLRADSHRTTREAVRYGVVNPTLRRPGTSQARIYSAADGDDDYALARDLERAWHITGDECGGGDRDECGDECGDELDDDFDAEAGFLSLSHLGNRVAELSSAVGTLKRQVSGDSEVWSEVASEWSAVSAAETAWSTIADEAPLPTRTPSWGTIVDDAALARTMQMEEWDSLLPRTSATARNARQTARPAPSQRGAAAMAGRASAQACWVPPRQPKVAPVALRQLRDACGLCVVCRESLALVAWEPCGHLALCEACREQIPRHQQRYCVVCRTEGAPVHLLRPRDAGGASGALPPRAEATAAAAQETVVAAEEEEEAAQEAAAAEDDEFVMVDNASQSAEDSGGNSDEGDARRMPHGDGFPDGLDDGDGADEGARWYSSHDGGAIGDVAGMASSGASGSSALGDGSGSYPPPAAASADGFVYEAPWEDDREDDQFEAFLRGVGLSVSAHDGTLGALRPVASQAAAERERERAAGEGGSKLAYKLAYQQAKRQINVRAKAAKRSGFMRSAEFKLHHPKLFEEERQWREAREAHEARQRFLPRRNWHSCQQPPAQMARQRRTHLQTEQRTRAQYDPTQTLKPEDAAQRKAEARAEHLGSRQAVRELLKSARAEEDERQAMLWRAARTAEAASRALGGACRACGQRDACMLAIQCGHVTLCRECWEGGGRPAEARQSRTHNEYCGQRKATGSGGGGVCALCCECGGECKLAVQIFRPLA